MSNALFCIMGFLFISVVGSLNHFVYEWSGHNKVAAIFGSVNESTWEHIKMSVFPTFLWGIVGYFLKVNNIELAVMITLLSEIIIIPLIFYTYKSIIKRTVLVIDISSFFIAIGVGCWASYFIITQKQFSVAVFIIAFIIDIIILVSFSLFTYFPPKNFLFLDPLTKKYGIEAHVCDFSQYK